MPMRFRFHLELSADPALLATLGRITAALRENAAATRHQAHATQSLARAVHSLRDRHAAFIELGPLELVDKP
jgi:hypothetical protein